MIKKEIQNFDLNKMSFFPYQLIYKKNALIKKKILQVNHFHKYFVKLGVKIG